MKAGFKYLIGLLVGVILTLLIFLYLVPEPIIDDTDYIELKTRYDSLAFELDKLEHINEEMIKRHKEELQDKLDEQTKIVSRYEKKIKSLSDVTIVSNDSITSFISSRIYNR